MAVGPVTAAQPGPLGPRPNPPPSRPGLAAQQGSSGACLAAGADAAPEVGLLPADSAGADRREDLLSSGGMEAGGVCHPRPAQRGVRRPGEPPPLRHHRDGGGQRLADRWHAPLFPGWHAADLGAGGRDPGAFAAGAPGRGTHPVASAGPCAGAVGGGIRPGSAHRPAAPASPAAGGEDRAGEYRWLPGQGDCSIRTTGGGAPGAGGSARLRRWPALHRSAGQSGSRHGAATTLARGWYRCAGPRLWGRRTLRGAAGWTGGDFHRRPRRRCGGSRRLWGEGGGSVATAGLLPADRALPP